MSTEMPADLKRWDETRKRGRARYILTTGVLAWGIPMFVVMTFVVNRRSDGPPSPAMIAFSAVLWACGGGLFGAAMWRYWEKRYQQFLTSQSSVQESGKPTEEER